MTFITKEAPVTQAIQTQTALAVAFMADRLNKGYIKETRRFSEDTPTQFANKEIVKYYFNEEHNFTPEDYVKAIPTDEDFDSVDLALTHFKRYSMELLGDGLSDFQKSVFGSIQGPTVAKNQLGLVSYVPELVRREVSDAMEGCFVGATLIDNVEPGMSVYENEIFGPVLSFVRAETYEDAMNITHSHKLGNGAAIFTRDGGVAQKWTNEIQAGSIGINVPIPLPTYTHSFGGWKDSGFSETKAFGPSSIDFYTKTKSVATRWPDPKDSKVDLGFPKNDK